jgi:hypothetical protein
LTERLIDDRGAVWAATSDAITYRLGTRLERGDDVVSQTVALGFIFFKLCASGVLIALQPQIITEKAISRLSVLITELQPLRVGISCHGAVPSWEIVAGTAPAIARIDALVHAARNPRPRPILVDNLLPLDRCNDFADGYLLPLLQVWRERQQRWDPEIFRRLQAIGLAEMTAVYRQPPRSERLIIDNWGNSFSLYGDEWPSIARGRDIEDQPNALLGQLHGHRLRRELAQGVPQLAASEVLLRRIDQTLVRIKYVRLTLPWEMADGTRLITGMRMVGDVFILQQPGTIKLTP